MKLSKTLLSVALAGFTQAHANSEVVSNTTLNQRAGYYEIKNVTLERISGEEIDSDFMTRNMSQDQNNWNNCSEVNEKTPTGASKTRTETSSDKKEDKESSGGISDYEDYEDYVDDLIGRRAPSTPLGEIINTAQKTWTFIVNNRPVITTKTKMANALPKGLACWNELENWSAPRAETYRVSYKNGFNMTVVDFAFRLIYTYGGQLNGKGRFLTNTTIQYQKLDVLWGFNFNANVEVPQVINLGTSNDPIAGIQIAINYEITSAMGVNEIRRSNSFFVYGDGQPVDVH